MKTIGLLGGMSWESTVEYYRIINETVKQKLGGLHSGRIVLYSFDFQEIADMQEAGDWAGAMGSMAQAAVALKLAGAEFVVICTNTMHKVSDEVEAASGLPVLHIAECTADEIQEKGFSKVGVLGTRLTMEGDFLTGRLNTRGIETVVPDKDDRDFVNSVIFGELCLGQIKQESRKRFLDIIAGLAEAGAQGVVLGCTEIPLLVRQKDTAVPLFDTTYIHAYRAALMSLGDVDETDPLMAMVENRR